MGRPAKQGEKDFVVVAAPDAPLPGALSTYTRRRLAQGARAAVDSVERVPAARSRCQRPGLLGVRSTFGASTELLN
ncbi:hypothetical protein AB0M31_20985 [Streptomyces sp. NPDC051773]|uniref:hypothetical protein n=1 Tax=Streptomyces sp. NPDC051773 TaxID=3156682 RepID=UPI00341A379A